MMIKADFFRIPFFLLVFLCLGANSYSQKLITKRPTIYTYLGVSGAKLNQFNQMLEQRGLSELRNRYHSMGLGYQVRYNDFVLGAELLHNRGVYSDFDGYKMGFRTSRALINFGYAFTEESKFQLIHYMSLGVGFLNFQMLPENRPSSLEDFLNDPKRGFILRKNDIQKGSLNYGNFLTEIGFQLSYDFDLPGREEAVSVLAKMGYSFSPFEGKWQMNGLSFDNTQSGAFFRVGAGITMPDRNFFYKDASISAQFISGIHFTSPKRFNEVLDNAGYETLDGIPSNLGIRITAENEKLLYGAEVFNLAMKGDASSSQTHSLNSLRVYGRLGYKILQYKNIGFGATGGIGFGNLRYALLQDDKPDFPELFEGRKYDGYLRNSGLMAKPEVFVEYGLPVSKRKLFDLLFTVSGGFELAMANYRLAELDMASFMTGPYLMFGIGVRP